jgi:hypothetical protein
MLLRAYGPDVIFLLLGTILVWAAGPLAPDSEVYADPKSV